MVVTSFKNDENARPPTLLKTVTTTDISLSTQSTFKDNCGNTQKINFQFHHRKFSQQRYSILSYYHRRVARGGRGGLLSHTSLKIGRKYPDFGKRCTDFGHLCVKFLEMFLCLALFFLPS